ncbi:hypothetical protein WR25_00236 [Diploscapter pachys]|uniref:Uncharacterized protein n=1 Tax=Diploscapter pachys TaxID=2018661 RepID=A0A2A2KYS6_9BILA|nr:hypothetical protein WR25_00236 [Diploscapter pachys]
MIRMRKRIIKYLRFQQRHSAGGREGKAEVARTSHFAEKAKPAKTSHFTGQTGTAKISHFVGKTVMWPQADYDRRAQTKEYEAEDALLEEWQNADDAFWRKKKEERAERRTEMEQLWKKETRWVGKKEEPKKVKRTTVKKERGALSESNEVSLSELLQQVRQMVNEGRELPGLRTPKKKSEKRGIRTRLPQLWERVRMTVMPIFVKSEHPAPGSSSEASTSAAHSSQQQPSHPPSQSQDMGAPEVVMNNDMERPERHSTLTPGLLGLAVGSPGTAADSQPTQQNASNKEVTMKTTPQGAQESDTKSDIWWRYVKTLSSSKASKIQVKKLFSEGGQSDDSEETTAPVAKKRKGEGKAGGEASSSKQKSKDVPKVMPHSGSSEDEEERDYDVANLDDLEDEEYEEDLEDGVDAPDGELQQMVENAAQDQDEDWSKLRRLIESARNAHRQRDPDYRSDITITTGNAYLNIPTRMKDGTVVKNKDYLKIEQREKMVNYALRLSGPAFAKYVAALHRAGRKEMAEVLRVAREMMLERRAAVDEVVLTIQREQANSGGEVWDKHTDIEKFVKAVEDREDLKQLLEAGGATLKDLQSRLEHLRYAKEYNTKVEMARPAVNAVVVRIQEEQISSGRKVWNKHYEIDKFVSEVSRREDLKQLLEAGGATSKDLQSRLKDLRRDKEVNYFLKSNEY